MTCDAVPSLDQNSGVRLEVAQRQGEDEKVSNFAVLASAFQISHLDVAIRLRVDKDSQSLGLKEDLLWAWVEP